MGEDEQVIGRIMAQLQTACAIDDDTADHFMLGDVHCQLFEDAKLMHAKQAARLYARHSWQLRTPELKFQFIERVVAALARTGRTIPDCRATSHEHIYRGGAPFRSIVLELECVCVIAEMIQSAPTRPGRDARLVGECPVAAFRDLISSAHTRMAVLIYDRARVSYAGEDIENRLYDRFQDTFGVTESTGKDFYRMVRSRR